MLLSPSRKAAADAEQRPDDNEWVGVRRGDFEILCRDEGDLRPVKVTSLTCLRWGKIAYIIPEGTVVKKGDKVLTLETKELEEQLQRHQEDLTAVEKNLAQQEQNRDLELKRLGIEMQAEKDRVALAQLKEKEILSKPTPIEKEAAENALAGAKMRLSAAQAALDAFVPLAERGIGSKTDLESKRTAVAQAQVELQRAEMKHRKTMDGALPHEKQRASLEREQAELALKTREIDTADNTDNLLAKVQAAQRDLEHSRRKRDRSKTQLDESTVCAPYEGVISYRIMGRSNKKPELGEYVGPWAAPIDLPNYEKMKVRTQVPESFVRRLEARSQTTTDGRPPRKGSPARVMIKTLPDRVYTGEVTWIDGWARDRNSKLSDADVKAQGLSGVRVFDIEVELDESDPQRLREGFRAMVEFPVESLHDVLSIPVRAVSTRNGAPQVQVKTDSGREWRKVELGPTSMDRVVIKSGLTETDRVFVPRALRKPESQEKKPGENGEKGPGGASIETSPKPGGSGGSKSGGSKGGGRKGGRG